MQSWLTSRGNSPSLCQLCINIEQQRARFVIALCETRLKGTKRRGEKEIDQRHRHRAIAAIAAAAADATPSSAPAAADDGGAPAEQPPRQLALSHLLPEHGIAGVRWGQMQRRGEWRGGETSPAPRMAKGEPGRSNGEETEGANDAAVRRAS